MRSIGVLSTKNGGQQAAYATFSRKGRRKSSLRQKPIQPKFIPR
jgi:hypothetical protein